MKRIQCVEVCLVALLIHSMATYSQAGIVTSLDEIEFWVGSGANQAALLFDWQGDLSTDNALAWGYRWDGTATGKDMFFSIVAADPRLFAKVGNSGALGEAVFGVGYDANDDGEFSLDDGTSFAADGIAHTGPSDGAKANDPGDLYSEGWFIEGFWHYGRADANPFGEGEWQSASGGLASRTLSDGSWDSLAFTPMFSSQAFAQNPVAASSSFSADFDSDGKVDGHDFLTWQRYYNTSSDALPHQGDANGDGVVDTVDLQHWAMSFGNTTTVSSTASGLQIAGHIVPEPSCLACFCGAGVLVLTVQSFLRVPLPTRRRFS